MSSKVIIRMLEKSITCFKNELTKTVNAIDYLKKIHSYSYDDNGYDRQYLQSLILRADSNNAQKEERRLIINFCNETYRHLILKKQYLIKYQEESNSMIQKLKKTERITFEKALAIEVHLRVAFASVDLRYPEEWAIAYKRKIDVQ